jgi:hypothetical protein
MSLREYMRESALPFLHAGEPVQEVFSAQTSRPWLRPLTGFVFFPLVNSYRIVVVTAERTVVLDAGRVSRKRARRALGELPRVFALGPTPRPTPGRWHVIALAESKLHVHRRYFADLDAADRAGSSRVAHSRLAEACAR